MKLKDRAVVVRVQGDWYVWYLSSNEIRKLRFTADDRESLSIRSMERRQARQ